MKVDWIPDDLTEDAVEAAYADPRMTPEVSKEIRRRLKAEKAELLEKHAWNQKEIARLEELKPKVELSVCMQRRGLFSETVH